MKTCENYLEDLAIKLSFQEIGNMYQWTFKRLVKEKTKTAELMYLLSQKQKQTKTSTIQYNDLKIQEYFIDGNCKRNKSKLIFKARSKTLDIKRNRNGNMQIKLV